MTNRLLDIRIEWRRIINNIRYCYAHQDGRLLLLRMNNFPDEPMFTLIDGIDIFDIDDLPEKWIYPYLNEN